MSTGIHDARDGATRSRDLGSVELWERSLARSRQRRRLFALSRRNRRRRKSISMAMAASMAGGTVFPPVVAAATGGPGSPSTGADANGSLPGSESSKVVLELGSQGGLVAAAQRRLNEVLPLSHLAVDGIYGPLTRAAVRDFQRRDGLRVDGMIDAGTWAKLFNAPVLVFGAADAGAAGGPSTGATASPAHSQFVSVSHPARAVRARAIHAQADKVGGSTGAANGPSGGSIVAGGPGGTATPAPETASASARPTPPPATGGSSGGGTTVSVVAPTVPSTQPSTYVLTNGVALPLPRQYITGGYVDQGVDYAAPGGTPEYAMGDGVIIGEGISGFGPNAPILRITSGPLAGLEVYYGHAGTNLVRVGDHVKAGQQITQVGYGIVGISTGPHLEIGFYPPGGRGAGSKMLSVINALLRQHPTGRAWGSSTTTTASAHVARDTQTTGTPVSYTSSTGGVAVPQPVAAAAPAPASSASAPSASAAPAPATAPSGAPAPVTSSAPAPVTPVPSSTTATASPATAVPAAPAATQPTEPVTAPVSAAPAAAVPATPVAATTPPADTSAPASAAPAQTVTSAPAEATGPEPSPAAAPVASAPAAPPSAAPADDSTTPASPSASPASTPIEAATGTTPTATSTDPSPSLG